MHTGKETRRKEEKNKKELGEQQKGKRKKGNRRELIDKKNTTINSTRRRKR
jgi:hypothetical protein